MQLLLMPLIWIWLALSVESVYLHTGVYSTPAYCIPVSPNLIECVCFMNSTCLFQFQFFLFTELNFLCLFYSVSFPRLRFLLLLFSSVVLTHFKASLLPTHTRCTERSQVKLNQTKTWKLKHDLNHVSNCSSSYLKEPFSTNCFILLSSHYPISSAEHKIRQRRERPALAY